MNRTRALIVSLAVGVAAVAGVFALGPHPLPRQPGARRHGPQVAQRTAQLDRYEASLRKALAQKPPALPPVPAAGTPPPRRQSAVERPAPERRAGSRRLPPPPARSS